MSPWVLPLGLVIGLTLGALGGGGSILAVPALVYVLNQDAATATTTSLVIVGITSVVALVPHARQGRVKVVEGSLFGALGTAGSFVGSRLALNVPGPVLLSAFAVLMLIVAIVMLRRSQRQSSAHPGAAGVPAEPMLTLHPFGCACPRLLKVIVTATAVGLLTGFFGVGGGFIIVPALVLALGFTMPVAVGTSLLVISVNSATALMARLTAGTTQLDWGLIVGFTAAAIAGSLLGGRITSIVQPRHLTRGFAFLLVVVALYTGARSVPALF